MLEEYKRIGEKLLEGWKGDRYTFGGGALSAAGKYAAEYGKRALVVAAQHGEPGGEWMEPILKQVTDGLAAEGVDCVAIERGARPNAPREDVYRIAAAIAAAKPDSVVAVGGGSTIDACKAAAVLATYGGNDIEPYFGVDLVAAVAAEKGKAPIPVIAAQTAPSSGAHLTKYSNITDPETGIKKLIVDETIVPPAAVFDYEITVNTPMGLTLDGALDGIAHCWEVFMGANGKVYYEEIKDITIAATQLIVNALPVVVKDPMDIEAREALGIGTDLGGYAIMISKRNPRTGADEKGGTNGGHLGSFQLINYLAHGRACAVLNPYYTVLFADAIVDQCRTIGAIFKEAGFIPKDMDLAKLSSRDLAEAVAEGMIGFSMSIGFPATLEEAGVPESQIDIMIEASKNPQLKMKLQNMPMPLDVEAGEIDTKMGPTLRAAFTGDLSLIP
ncbi:MAG: iron-containing alcohol dehydrogenase [bacterium]